MRTVLRVALAGLLAGSIADAADTASLMQSAPQHFDQATGFRIARHRAPTPDDIPGTAKLVSPREAQRLLSGGALAVDVFGAAQSHFDALDGTWLVAEPRLSLPGAVWLPEVGRGVLDDAMSAYLADNLRRLTKGDLEKPLVVFCVADCWMSWNAAQRIAALGYENVAWFRLGTDGWLDQGGELTPVEPVPVAVD